MKNDNGETESKTAPPARKKGRIANAVNWTFILLLGLSCLAPFVNPAVFWPLAFSGLLFPLFFLVNALLLLWWTIRRKRRGFYSLAMFLLSLPMYFRQAAVFGTKEKSPPGAVKIMSYNVKLFDLYNWTGNRESRAEIFSLLKAQQPQLLCLQEFFNQDTGRFRNLDSLKKLLALPYAHTEYTISLHGDDHWGMATFSQFPIVNEGKIVFNNRSNNICIYTDILMNGDTVRVYNMHLQSISFGYADLKFLREMSKAEQSADELENSRNILRRMKRAYIRRANQSQAVADHIAQCPYPVIVCGDFNDTPTSYTYRTIGKNLEDSFLESGRGFGKTFINPFPFPRIDYIFHSSQFSTWQFNVIRTDNLSDHYPVECMIRKNK
ncbi:MAG TPA: endonuclease/exonuclease/phosphatase family protein [Bacteroidia bacterium]|nr:endonuclease/exonuclease/phosphatase family protein [Bacteroidia bacterium]